MSQKSFWEREYRKKYPDLTGSSKPSHAISFLFNFIKQKNVFHGKALEIGCGRGRNMFFLAQNGFDTWGVDFSKEALRIARKNIRSNREAQKMHFKLVDIAKQLPFVNNSFDLVLDVLASGTLNEKERVKLRKEIWRVLKPGGYFLIYAPNRKRAEQSKYLRAVRGKNGIFINPGLGLREKSYYLDELPKIFNTMQFIKGVNIEYIGTISGKPNFLSYVCGIFKKETKTLE